LLDRRVSALRVAPAEPGSDRATAIDAALFRNVSKRAQIVPTRVTGPLEGVPVGEHRDLALAVNGRIRAVGRSFDFVKQRFEYFSFVVPEQALRSGPNRMELFEVQRGGALVRIASL
jgi:hypothetical protein